MAGKSFTQKNAMRALPLCFIAMLLLAASCSSIDCPLNSLVYTQYQLMTPEGRVDTLADTLTIYTKRVTDGSDSVLINRNVRTTEFSLPISYSQAQDVFYFETIDTVTKVTTTDVVTITKEDHNNAIDSIVIINPDVSYDTSKKHLYIYFKHRD